MRYKRHTDIFNPNDHTDRSVTIAGVGGTGSNVAIALTKMGIANLHIIDPDVVEDHNLASQAYTLEDVGQPKVEALEAKIKSINPEINLLASQAEFNHIVDDLFICGVDGWDTRKEIQERLRREQLVIDGRMGGEQVECWVVKAKNWDLSGTPDPDPCAGQYISYTAYLIAGLITSTVRKILTDSPVRERVVIQPDNNVMLCQ